MRSFAFVDHLKFAIDGNISKDSITLADFDNDSVIVYNPFNYNLIKKELFINYYLCYREMN